jgi:hypothetical protein
MVNSWMEVESRTSLSTGPRPFSKSLAMGKLTRGDQSVPYVHSER